MESGAARLGAEAAETANKSAANVAKHPLINQVLAWLIEFFLATIERVSRALTSRWQENYRRSPVPQKG